MGGVTLAVSVDRMHRRLTTDLILLSREGAGLASSAGLDELQNLGTQPPRTTLAIQRLEDESGCRGEIARFGTLPGLAIPIPSSVEQMMAL